jgi:hypothetical protein
MTTDEAWKTATVQMAASEAADVAGTLYAKHHRQMLEAMKLQSRAESPIEAVFWIWWVTLTSLDAAIGRDRDYPLVAQFVVTVGDHNYRLDFAVPDAKVGIELDGHDFHEKTKEQVAYRNQRDRDLQAAGWVVMHFSGSELLREQAATVAEVLYMVEGRMPKGVVE